MSTENPFASQETQDEITTRVVAENLIINPEDTELLVRFMEQQEQKVESGEVTDLDYNVSLADIYALVAEQNPNFREFALQAYLDAGTVASHTPGKEEEAISLLAKAETYR